MWCHFWLRCIDISGHQETRSQSRVLTGAVGYVSMTGIKRGHGPDRSGPSAAGITPARAGSRGFPALPSGSRRDHPARAGSSRPACPRAPRTGNHPRACGGCHDHAMIPARDPRRIGLHEHLDRPKVQRPPPAPARARVARRATPRALPAPVPLPLRQPHRRDEHAPVLVELHALDDRVLEPEQPTS